MLIIVLTWASECTMLERVQFHSGSVSVESQEIHSYSVWCCRIVIICLLIQSLPVVLNLILNVFDLSEWSPLSFCKNLILKIINEQSRFFFSMDFNFCYVTVTKCSHGFWLVAWQHDSNVVLL